MNAGSLCGTLRTVKEVPCIQYKKAKEKQVLIHVAVMDYQMP